MKVPTAPEMIDLLTCLILAMLFKKFFMVVLAVITESFMRGIMTGSVHLDTDAASIKHIKKANFSTNMKESQRVLLI